MASSRRAFFADVGKGVIAAGLGSALATDLGCNLSFADERPNELTFGALEPLVRLLQDTEPTKLIPVLVEKLRGGVELKSLTAAAALANARSFGGDDYVGFHTMMALGPAWEMARELPESERALPVFKVLYRNTNRIHEKGGHAGEALKAVAPKNDDMIRHVRAKNKPGAEAALAHIAAHSPEHALNAVVPVMAEATEVHRVVLIWRAWDLLNLVGKEHAHTMLRQSLRYCINSEGANYMKRFATIRELVPKLLDQHKLPREGVKQTEVSAQVIEQRTAEMFRAKPEQAAEMAAAMLGEGQSPSVVAEVIRQVANHLVLRDPGRSRDEARPGKQVGSVHGDGIGVHACDSANAWCNLAKVSDARNSAICLILGAYQAALDRVSRGPDLMNMKPLSDFEPGAVGRVKAPVYLLKDLEAAIRDKDQKQAMDLVSTYGHVNADPVPLFSLLRRYAISEDGALHAEKYFQTVRESFMASRPALRWSHAVSLARVTASAYGFPAPGLDEARKLLKV